MVNTVTKVSDMIDGWVDLIITKLPPVFTRAKCMTKETLIVVVGGWVVVESEALGGGKILNL